MIDFFDAFFDDFYDEFYYDLAPAESDRWIIDFYSGVDQRLYSTLVVAIARSCLQVTETSSDLDTEPALLAVIGSATIGTIYRIG
jgi:hypothetical protein